MPSAAADGFSSVEQVREAEARLLRDRRLANELLDLMDATFTAHDNALRLAATQACRSLFATWAAAGEMRIGPRGEETQGELASDVAFEAAAAAGDSVESRRAQALKAYREWLEEKYKRFVSLLCEQLCNSDALPALRLLALDSLMLLAAAEVRYARPGRGLYHAALGATSGALAQLLGRVVSSGSSLPATVLHRFRDAHAQKLDVAYYLMRHVKCLAKPNSEKAASSPARAERLLELMMLVTPPASDVAPAEAQFLVSPRDDAGSEPEQWSTTARSLLQRQRHQKEFCDAWRALLKLPLPGRAYRRVLITLPEGILPYVPKPLRFCDLLSDGYSRGGLEALLSLKGLFVLMHKHNLEYPQFYRQLYTLVRPSALCGAYRERFALELDLFLSSSGLPAYVSAAFAKRLGRLALGVPPNGAALACGIVYNLLLRQQPVRLLVHKAADGGVAAFPIGADSFVEDEDDPRLTGALDSCLWEIDTLRHHYCPTVSSIAKMFAKPFSQTTRKVELQPLAALSADSLMKVELNRRLKRAPLAHTLAQPVGAGSGAGSSGLAKLWVE